MKFLLDKTITFGVARHRFQVGAAAPDDWEKAMVSSNRLSVIRDLRYAMKTRPAPVRYFLR
ncbi:MAG: hypothetical protein K0B01_00440 [Syntrophobacterales bacterium]|nr:hypothetical protein [Syntrophobacterales bacterium]